jgi:transposase
MTNEEEIAHLRTENQELRELLRLALEQGKIMQAQIQAATVRIQELEKQKTPPPPFVKANKKQPPSEEKKARKKRDTTQNGARRRSSTPTNFVEHRITTCPECHLHLGGISLARSREVIDTPPPPPIEITEHRIYKGWCSSCKKWHEAPVDLHEQVMGQGRIGVRIASLIATLRTVMRLPIRQIQMFLHTLHGFQVSTGEIVELLHRIKEQLEPTLTALKMEIRASPALQADETGWREDGLNGYIWSVSTFTIRYYEYHHSREGKIVKLLIGDDYGGVLGSDFYGGYNIHQGLHQRCWVHFLRDVHELKEKHPDDVGLLMWAASVKAIYDHAVAWTAQTPDLTLSPRKQEQTRIGQQHVFEKRLLDLCQPFVLSDTPQRVLCKRVEQFLPELFVFVAIPGIPAHNNLAERSVRPLVIARKISGGTRSPKGSATRMGLASLFGTWIAQTLNPFHQCLAALTLKSSLG